MQIKAIITGATGMVGEGVLHACLQDPQVVSVLVLNRKPLGLSHPKLREVLHSDFFDLSAVEGQLAGYNACFFCLGVTAVGMKEPDYFRLTYTLTLHVAETLVRVNPGMTFCYVSGGGTDTSERGRIMWARVKGKTENDLGKLPFKAEYNFRPGFLKPDPGAKYVHSFYKYINWMYPLGRALYPKGFCSLRELGLAMLQVVEQGAGKKALNGKDIIALAAAR
ncbi:hypothetical protein GA0116948_10519 [Chitinophaga costaii]|uniref:NAD-dependent epimerase/dehydratase domain-containing protein n=1 Tax=Chitinophaga costaii TaxID=1335309 RepID=A0A1C4D1D5_9BACT|nr:NAD-dependent epimerase/dehydratase family protein [Chitinophaga costaii]PUZ24418.1 epimerase [Chitinophaga costaii]SCC25163.1 hypothetical protein GA0116948_10519 [Chitinophaga costaii]